MKRQRGRNRRSSGGQNNNINRHFESNGPDVKIRGSAQQVLEKYLQYAREAQTNGDRVKSEAYFQHAEHYQRTLAMMQANQKPKRDRDENRNRDQDQDRSDAEDTEADVAETGDEPSGGKGKRDPLRVIGDDETTSADETNDDGQDASAEEAKPKRTRRRTYKKRDEDAAEAGAAEEADGVMKTLSRGRKTAKPKDEAASEDSAPEPTEGAAAE